MADILPFAALRYDPRRAAPAQVVTQPYDKITSVMQERYYAASPYNLVRIILGRRLDTDNTEDNVYTRAAARFRDWRREGIYFVPKPDAPLEYSIQFFHAASFVARASISTLSSASFV